MRAVMSPSITGVAWRKYLGSSVPRPVRRPMSAELPMCGARVVRGNVEAAVDLLVLIVRLLIEPRRAASECVGQLRTIGLSVIALEHLEDQGLSSGQRVYSNRRSAGDVAPREREARVERL